MQPTIPEDPAQTNPSTLHVLESERLHDARSIASTGTRGSAGGRRLSSTSNVSQTASSTTALPSSAAAASRPTQAWRPSTIRLRRFPTVEDLPRAAAGSEQLPVVEESQEGNRRRSSSEPQRPQWGSMFSMGGGRRRAGSTTVPDTIQEVPSFPVSPADREKAAAVAPNRRQHASTVNGGAPVSAGDHEYDSNLVDLLDLVDPEIGTLTTLTNVQNSLFVPSLGRFLNRNPTYNLTRHQKNTTDPGDTPPKPEPNPRPPPVKRTNTGNATIGSALEPDEPRYAIVPDGVSLEGWSTTDKQELNDHVRHLLHSRKARFRRAMKGFGQYASRPLGFFVTLYATLITIFGLIWVLFLIGWIEVGGRKSYITNIIDNILVALFAIMGDGLAPFRMIDTYHMIFIAHYHHLTLKIRKQQALPELENHNDLPLETVENSKDVEAAREGLNGKEFSVLSPEQQKKLEHHQKKFNRSHTFYKPHETTTHHAFPLRILVAVVVLLDMHSMLQISLGACTWAINYHVRPFALTTSILCCSITCNITAGVLISIGDHRTRKKDVLERMHKQEVTQEAIENLEHRKEKERKRNEELDLTADSTLGRKSMARGESSTSS